MGSCASRLANPKIGAGVAVPPQSMRLLEGWGGVGWGSRIHLSARGDFPESISLPGAIFQIPSRCQGRYSRIHLAAKAIFQNPPRRQGRYSRIHLAAKDDIPDSISLPGSIFQNPSSSQSDIPESISPPRTIFQNPPHRQGRYSRIHLAAKDDIPDSI